MKEQQKYLEVMENTPAPSADKNGKNYNRLTVKPLAGAIVNPITGEFVPVIDMKARTGSFNQYEESYLLEGQSDLAFEAKAGTLLPGAIVTRSVPPYSFENKEGEEIHAETYTTIVFGDTTQVEVFENAVKAAFKSNGHDMEDIVIEETEQVAEIAEQPVEA